MCEYEFILKKVTFYLIFEHFSTVTGTGNVLDLP
jgi:hypothetical protein